MHIGPEQKPNSAHRAPIVHLSLNHKITNKRIMALCAFLVEIAATYTSGYFKAIALDMWSLNTFCSRDLKSQLWYLNSEPPREIKEREL